MTAHLDALSRILTQLLRHWARRQGVQMDSGGWVHTQDAAAFANQFPGKTMKNGTFILPLRFFATPDDVREVVSYEARFGKCRLALCGQGTHEFVRATQGHTISGVDLDMAQVDPAEVPLAVHGTFHEHWPKIQTDGLAPMGRNYIHLARGLPGEPGVISGMRDSCNLLIWVDIRMATSAGLLFYASESNAILTEGPISVAFFHEVVCRDTGAIVWARPSSTQAASPLASPAASGWPPAPAGASPIALVGASSDSPLAESPIGAEHGAAPTSISPRRLPRMRLRAGRLTCYRCHHFCEGSSQAHCDFRGHLQEVCQRCILFRVMRVGAALVDPEATARGEVLCRLGLVYSELTAEVAHAHFVEPDLHRDSGPPAPCGYCTRTVAHVAILTTARSPVSICRLCWLLHHIRVLTRYVPSDHEALMKVENTLQSCKTLLLGAPGVPLTCISRDFPSDVSLKNMRFVQPDEHIDGGPLPGPFYLAPNPPRPVDWEQVSDPSYVAPLTPRSDEEYERWD